MIPPRQDMTPLERKAAIEAIKAKLPTMNCLGHCNVACTGIDMSITEREIIRRRYGITIRKRRPTTSTTLHHDIHAFHRLTGQQVDIKDIPRDNPPCQALDVITKRCSCHKDRPVVCHVWGATEVLRCPWNCEPSYWLTAEEYYRITWEINRIGGHEEYTLEELAENDALLATPEGKAAFDAYMRTKVVETERKWFHMYFGLHPELRPDHWWGEETIDKRQNAKATPHTPDSRCQHQEGETDTVPVRARSSNRGSPGDGDA